jgi:hypothetical protein
VCFAPLHPAARHSSAHERAVTQGSGIEKSRTFLQPHHLSVDLVFLHLSFFNRPFYHRDDLDILLQSILNGQTVSTGPIQGFPGYSSVCRSFTASAIHIQASPFGKAYGDIALLHLVLPSLLFSILAPTMRETYCYCLIIFSRGPCRYKDAKVPPCAFEYACDMLTSRTRNKNCQCYRSRPLAASKRYRTRMREAIGASSSFSPFLKVH